MTTHLTKREIAFLQKLEEKGNLVIVIPPSELQTAPKKEVKYYILDIAKQVIDAFLK